MIFSIMTLSITINKMRQISIMAEHSYVECCLC
jgi:hypothetical protein